MLQSKWDGLQVKFDQVYGPQFFLQEVFSSCLESTGTYL